MAQHQVTARIKVGVRVRPLLDWERDDSQTNHILIKDNYVQIKSQDGTNQSKKYEFDYTFGQETTQDSLYAGCQIDKLVDRAIEGYHTTIFAYGQTGSGKTYTMQGAEDQQLGVNKLDGIIPKVAKQLFSKIKEATDRTFTIGVSFLQIYNEKIYDLFNPSSMNPRTVNSNPEGLRLRWTKSQQFTVQNLFVYECRSAQQLTKYFSHGLKNRITAAHKLNMKSSRSHSIMSIRIESFDHSNPHFMLSSKIELVDLAGSQRIGQTGTEGKLAKQSIDINKSLFTLRQVIATLSEQTKDQSHIPYRQSKLTSILKQSIGGNSYCLMIACISPNDKFLDENISTLNYASKATMITNKPMRNTDPRNNLVQQLTKQVKDLSQELDKANQHIEMIQKDPIEARFMSNVKRQPSGVQYSGSLIESINMVRELLKSNKELRDNLDKSYETIEKKDIEIMELERENERLREKIAEQAALVDQLQEENRARTSNYRNRHKSIKKKLNFISNDMIQEDIVRSQAKEVANLLQMKISQNEGESLMHTCGKKFFQKAKRTISSFNSLDLKGNYTPETTYEQIPTNFNHRALPQSYHQERSQSLHLHYRTLNDFGGSHKEITRPKRNITHERNEQPQHKMNKTTASFKAKMRKTFY